MSNDKKPKGNWRLLLVGVVLGSVITAGGFWITPLDFSKAKNSVINMVKNVNWGTLKNGSWKLIGLGETKVITTSKNKNNQTTVSEQIHPPKTFWDLMEILAVPILLATLTYVYQRRDKAKELEQANLEREIAQDNLAEEAIQAYLDNMAKFFLDKELKKELFSYVELNSILDEGLRKELSKLSTHDKLNLLDKEDNPVKDVARIQTITILRRFGLERDTDRQTRIIDFLRDTELCKFIFKNANLSGINLSEVSLRKVNFQGANLFGANLQNAILNKVNIQGNINKVTFEQLHSESVNLQEADLREANLQEASLKAVNLQGAELGYAIIQKADLTKANLQEANLMGANLQGADLKDANLQKACLLGANLQGAYLKDANLQKALLDRLDIKKITYMETTIEKAFAMSANLRKACLIDVALQGACLSKVDLQEANLFMANLQGANLMGANLQKADLSHADLRGADFRGANLQEAKLYEANLQGAYLSEVQNITPKQIKSACFWDKAIYKGELDWDKQTKNWVFKNEQAEQDNKNYIEDLKKDESSDPKEPVDYSWWER